MDHYGPYCAPPIETVGQPSRIQLYEIASINDDGTINARLTIGRTGKVRVPCPKWYLPVIGDRVYIADLNGNRQQPYIISMHDAGAATQGAPNVNVGSRAAITFDPLGAGVTFPAAGGLMFTDPAPFGSVLVADGQGGCVWTTG